MENKKATWAYLLQEGMLSYSMDDSIPIRDTVMEKECLEKILRTGISWKSTTMPDVYSTEDGTLYMEGSLRLLDGEYFPWICIVVGTSTCDTDIDLIVKEKLCLS